MENKYISLVLDNLILKELDEYYVLSGPLELSNASCAVPKKFCKQENGQVAMKASESWNFVYKDKISEMQVSANKLSELMRKEKEIKEDNYEIIDSSSQYSLLQGENGYILSDNNNISSTTDEEEVKLLTNTQLCTLESCTRVKNMAIVLDTEEEGSYLLNALQSVEGATDTDKMAYIKYLSNERIRLYKDAEQFDWYEYPMDYAGWNKELKAKQKIDNFVNDKAYEKSIPYPLRIRKQFVIWKWSLSTDENGNTKAIKIPINPWTGKWADTTDSFSWATFDKCKEIIDKYGKKYGYAGIGIVLGRGVMGIDLDHCIKDGVIEIEKRAIVDSVNSYTEYSPSGDGVHILCFGELPEGYKKRNDELGVECYDSGRFFTLTGHLFENEVRKMRPADDTREAVIAIADKYLKKDEQAESSPRPVVPVSKMKNALSFKDDAKLIEHIRNSATKDDFHSLFDKGEVPRDNNGLFKTSYMRQKQVGVKTKEMLDSNDKILQYYEMDHSKCDTRLCFIIASYTDDAEQIDRIFRQSALMRDKWDSKRADSTYGNNLCKYVLENRTFRAMNWNSKKKPNNQTKQNSTKSGQCME